MIILIIAAWMVCGTLGVRGWMRDGCEKNVRVRDLAWLWIIIMLGPVIPLLLSGAAAYDWMQEKKIGDMVLWECKRK